MNWDKWIMLSFLVFAAFIITLVVVCMRQDMSLVSREYYKDELVYQRQIDRMKNVENLPDKPVMEIVSDSLRITFTGFETMQSGTVALFRPSDERSDRTFDLVPGAGKLARFSVAGMPVGMYKARMSWSANNREYFIEHVVYR